MSQETATTGTKALIIGIIGIVIAAFGFYNGVSTGDERPLFSWLIGLSYWLSICVGMLFLIMIFYVFDAGWSVIIRRQLEHAVDGFKWLGLLFLPLLAVSWGLIGDDPGLLWKWMNPDKLVPGGHGTVAEDVIYQHKAGYLNLEFFTVRVALYFAIWIGFAWVMRMCSYRMDIDGKEKWAHIARKTSAGGLFFMAMGSTFAAFDWYMALEYHWFSTMYGVWFFAESMRSALSMIVIILFCAGTYGYLKGIVKQVHFYLIGCLMLAFTMFWTYISFSQYFLIYNANIPEETFWYNIRELAYGSSSKSGWWWVSMFLVFGQFLIPFLLLLQYQTKVKMKIFVTLACWMLITHLIDLYWNILPGKNVDEAGNTILREFSVTPYDIAMVVGVGGIMVWSFMRNAAKHKPIPIRDPRILESLNYHE